MGTQTSEVYAGLKQAIVEGEYQPAESLTEQDLAQQYGASRNTVKKALLMLEKENLVTVERNKSAKVRAFSPGEVEELLEVREALEGLVTRLAVPFMTPGRIEKLERLYGRMRGHIKAGELLAYSSCNGLFHSAIYDACPNAKAVEMVQGLKNQLKKYNCRTILVPGRSVRSMEEHKELLETIKQHNAELAGVLMCRHVANVRATFRENHELLL